HDQPQGPQPDAGIERGDLPVLRVLPQEVSFAPSAAGSYGRGLWMISIRLPSGSRTKNRSAPGMSVVSLISTPCWRKCSRAAGASSTPSGKGRARVVVGF